MKLSHEKLHQRLTLTGLCKSELYSLRVYYETVYKYNCVTHNTGKIHFPECLECLCQAAELLKGELNDKTSIYNKAGPHNTNRNMYL